MGLSVASATAKKAIKGLGWGTAIEYGINGGMAVGSYIDERNAGNGVIGSAVSAAVDNALPFVIGFGTYMAGAALVAAPGAIVSGAEKVNTMARSMEKMSRNTPFDNAQFQDSQQAYTMRQAGMQMAQRSKYNVQQSMLGNEARQMHR